MAGGRGPTLRPALAAGLAALILPYHVWLFAGGGDPFFSAATLACRDRAIADAVATIRADFPPATTEIVTSAYLQHMEYYLPEYGRVRFLNSGRDERWQTPPGIERTLIFDLEMRAADGGGAGADPARLRPLRPGGRRDAGRRRPVPVRRRSQRGGDDTVTSA